MQFLTSVFLLAGSAAASPLVTSRATNDTCMDKSTHVTEWYVHNFDFHASYTFSTPAHQNSWGYVNFTLANPVLNYRPVCSSSSSQLQDFYYGTQIYECKDPLGGIQASYTFNRPTGELKLNQTWSCEEEGGYVHAEGGVTLNLECSDETWENPKWKEGEIYSQRTTKCKEITLAKAPITSIVAAL